MDPIFVAKSYSQKYFNINKNNTLHFMEIYWEKNTYA